MECFHKGQRVVVHVRSKQKGRHTTLSEHMPKSHREYAGWTPQRITQWAAKLGPNVAAMTQAVMDARSHPAQGYRSSLGIIRLAKEFGEARLDAACGKALGMGSTSLKSLKSILNSGLDRLTTPSCQPEKPSIPHVNVRGAKYYQQEGVC